MAQRVLEAHADGTKPGRSRRLRRWRKAPGRFAKEESGASIVEFAIIGPLFLFTVFAMFETASIYWVDRVLQSYASDVARAARTGFTANITTTDDDGNEVTRLRDLCRDGVANMFFNCSNMMVDVREVSAASGSLRKQDGDINKGALIEKPGPPGSVNVVRVYYKWKPLFGVPFSPAGRPRPDGDLELFAGTGFVKE